MAAATFSELMNLAFVAAIAGFFNVVSIRRPPPVVPANALFFAIPVADSQHLTSLYLFPTPIICPVTHQPIP
jgi:hypothetical protein